MYLSQKWYSYENFTHYEAGYHRALAMVIFVLQRTPGVNFLYFIIDMTPAYEVNTKLQSVRKLHPRSLLP